LGADIAFRGTAIRASAKNPKQMLDFERLPICGVCAKLNKVVGNAGTFEYLNTTELARASTTT
jgi:hypothetical protein